LYVDDFPVSVNRIICLLAYFYLSHYATSEQTISFERYSIHEKPSWSDNALAINTDNVHIHTLGMEVVEADAFVDFANKRLHIHKVIPSATQEEVLFSCCPETFPGLLFCELLDDNEVIIIKGCRRFCDYTGYLKTFQFVGLFDPPKYAQDILVIDAVYYDHFTEGSVIRDMNKAYLSFKQVEKGKSISTGNWGCGMFGGDPVHKFIQQICASTITGVKLEYSTFKDEPLATKLREILSLIETKKATVADLFEAMLAMQKNRKAYNVALVQLSKLHK